jgi:hypothetical protein
MPEVTAQAPRPKPPGSPLLRNHRWQIDLSVLGTRIDPTSGRPVRRVVRTGRFVTERAARRWAKHVRQSSQHARLTYFTARDGWRGQAVGVLTDEGWARP